MTTEPLIVGLVAIVGGPTPSKHPFYAIGMCVIDRLDVRTTSVVFKQAWRLQAPSEKHGVHDEEYLVNRQENELVHVFHRIRGYVSKIDDFGLALRKLKSAYPSRKLLFASTDMDRVVRFVEQAVIDDGCVAIPFDGIHCDVGYKMCSIINCAFVYEMETMVKVAEYNARECQHRIQTAKNGAIFLGLSRCYQFGFSINPMFTKTLQFIAAATILIGISVGLGKIIALLDHRFRY